MLDILNVARTNNASLDITGVLVRKRDIFFQILEGEESAVRSLIEKIEKDSRHYEVDIIDERNVEERSFSDWSMGFASLEDNESIYDIEGFNNVLQQKETTMEALKKLNEGEKIVSLFKDTGAGTSKHVIRCMLR